MLLASIVAARILGKQQFGELGMIRSTVNMFSVFAGFGLGLTATKYIAEFRIRDINKTGKIIGLTIIFATVIGGLISCCIVLLAPFLANKTINSPNLITEIRLGAVILFFTSLNGAFTGILAGFEAIKSIAKINFLAGILSFPIQILLTLQWGLEGSIIGFGVNFLILAIFNFIIVCKTSTQFGVTISFKKSLDELPIIYKFSLPALLSGLMVSPIMWACNALLVNKPNGYSELAVFDAANQWRASILFIPLALSQIILPLLSDTENNYQFNKIVRLNIYFNFMISFIISLIISFFSFLIMSSYGPAFSDGQSVLIILAISSIFISVNNVIGHAIASKGKMWVGFFFNFIWGVTLLGCTYTYMNLGYGAKGLAYSFLISYLVHTLFQGIYAKKFII
jgi:O-antigen/teichoic acid export membrane protein